MILRDNVLVDTNYELPLYDIGMRIIYGTTEATIIGIELSCFSDRSSNIVTQIAYELDNNDTVLEEDITSYYEMEAVG